MKIRSRFIMAAAAALVTLVPQQTSAQEDVMRDVFGFFGSNLDVHVEAEAPGRVRFVRGERSRIEVAGRAASGFTSAALGGRRIRRLTLTAVGADRVDFVVIVPEDVRVRVYRPGSDHSDLFGALSHTATYMWDAPVARPGVETIRPAASADTHALPPALDIRRAHRLDRLTVRIGGAHFGITPRGLAEARGSGGTLSFDATSGGDVTVDVPEAGQFRLRLDGVDAIVVDDGDVRVLCESMLSQTLPDGTRWLTLTPVPRAGCSGDDVDRSEPPLPAARTLPARRT